MAELKHITVGDETFEPPPGWPLTVAMQQRAEALKTARGVMHKAQFLSNGPGAEVDDIIHMARFIVKGKRNWRVKDTKPEFSDLPMQELMTTTPVEHGDQA